MTGAARVQRANALRAPKVPEYLRGISLTSDEKRVTLSALLIYATQGPVPSWASFGHWSTAFARRCLTRAMREGRLVTRGEDIARSALVKLGARPRKEARA